MKPWEDKKTIRNLRKTKGGKKVLMGFELSELSLRLLKNRLKKEKNIRGKKLEEEVAKIIWQE